MVLGGKREITDLVHWFLKRLGFWIKEIKRTNTRDNVRI